MNVDIPEGFGSESGGVTVTRLGGSIVTPGTRINLWRTMDGEPFVGIVQLDGTLVMEHA